MESSLFIGILWLTWIVIVSMILYAFLWCLWDLIFRQPEVGMGMTTLWFLAIISLNIIGMLLYMYGGPGRSHWLSEPEATA